MPNGARPSGDDPRPEEGTEGEGGARGETEPDPYRILFVCTGNTCRSPTAEALAREAARRRGLPVECRSAGTGAAAASGASRGAVMAAREADLDLSGHSSRRLTRELAEWADVVVCMTEEHARAARRLVRPDDVVLITDFLPEGDPERGAPVPDPVGHGLEAYRETLQLLRQSVEGLLEHLSRR